MLENIVSALYQGQYAIVRPVVGLTGDSAILDSDFCVPVL